MPRQVVLKAGEVRQLLGGDITDFTDAAQAVVRDQLEQDEVRLLDGSDALGTDLAGNNGGGPPADPYQRIDGDRCDLHSLPATVGCFCPWFEGKRRGPSPGSEREACR